MRVFRFACWMAVRKPLVSLKIKHMFHVHMCIGMCVCVHMRMNLGGGSSGCQAHAIWAAGEGVVEVRSQN